MIRPKVRLSTLALLILIAAQLCALIAQRGREAALQSELQRSRAEAEVARIVASARPSTADGSRRCGAGMDDPDPPTLPDPGAVRGPRRVDFRGRGLPRPARPARMGPG